MTMENVRMDGLPAGAEVTLTIKLTAGPWTQTEGGYERRWSGPPDEDGKLPVAAEVTRKLRPWPFQPVWAWKAGDPYGDEWNDEGTVKGRGPEEAMGAADQALLAIVAEIE